MHHKNTTGSRQVFTSLSLQKIHLLFHGNKTEKKEWLPLPASTGAATTTTAAAKTTKATATTA